MVWRDSSGPLLHREVFGRGNDLEVLRVVALQASDEHGAKPSGEERVSP